MESVIGSIAVFCGARLGYSADYGSAAKDLGCALVDHNLELVYGGGSCGVMGVLADSMLSLSGRVVGVIPKYLLKKETNCLSIV